MILALVPWNLPFPSLTDIPVLLTGHLSIYVHPWHIYCWIYGGTTQSVLVFFTRGHPEFIHTNTG